jgi:hypothetical protein
MRDLKKQIVTPKCCEAAQKWPVVQFCINNYDNTENSDGRWTGVLLENAFEIFGNRDWSGWYDKKPDVKFCTYCGKELPKMVRTKPRPERKVCKITDGGYYCDTCGERLMNCECDLPSSVFEPDIRKIMVK